MKKKNLMKVIAGALAIATVSTFALVGCGETEPTTEPAVSEATSAADTTGEKETLDISVGVLSNAKVSQEQLSESATKGLAEYRGDSFPVNLNAQFTYYDTMNSALMALSRGDVAFLMMPEIAANYAVAQNESAYLVHTMGDGNHGNPTIKRTEEQISLMKQMFANAKVDFSMAAADKNAALIEDINTTIAELEQDGTLAKLQETYLTTEQPTPAELPVIEGAETYTVAITGDMAPIDFTTADGTAAGYNIALLSAISEKAGINFTLNNCDAGARALQLTSGKSDLVFWSRTTSSGVSEMPEGIITSNPYLTQTLVLLEPVK